MRAGLHPKSGRRDGSPRHSVTASRVPVNVYRIEDATPGQELTGELNYEGVINYVVKDSGCEYSRAFAQSPGLIESSSNPTSPFGKT